MPSTRVRTLCPARSGGRFFAAAARIHVIRRPSPPFQEALVHHRRHDLHKNLPMTFYTSVLPRRLRRCNAVLCAHCSQHVCKVLKELTVVVMNGLSRHTCAGDPSIQPARQHLTTLPVLARKNYTASQCWACSETNAVTPMHRSPPSDPHRPEN